MRVKVTLGHIAQSTTLRPPDGTCAGRSTTCPIAIALNEQAGGKWSVDGKRARDLLSGRSSILPVVAGQFVSAADRNHYANAVNPIEFDLPI